MSRAAALLEPLRRAWRGLDERVLLDSLSRAEREALQRQVFTERAARIARVGPVAFLVMATVAAIDYRRAVAGTLFDNPVHLGLLLSHLMIGMSGFPALMLRRRLGRDPADPQRVLQGVYLVLGLGGVGVMGVLNLLDRQDSFGYASMMMVTNFLYYLPSRTRWTVNGLCLLVALAAVLQIAAGTGLFGHILVNQIIMSTVFAALAGSALHLQQLRAIRSEQQLAALVRSDALTGLASRAHVQAVLGDALEARAGTPMPVSVLLLDLDRFKSVNDLFGHNMGDTVLRAVAAGLYDHLPQGMVCGRWGGEEFLVVCPGIALPEAAALAERLRVRVGQLDLPPVERCSASFGVAEAQPDESPEHLVGRADAGLYAAKQAGRDRVVVVEHAAH